MLKNQIRQSLLDCYTNHQLEQWFDPLEIYSTGNELFVYLPHNLFAVWFNEKFKKDFEKNLKSASWAKSNLIYVVRDFYHLEANQLQPETENCSKSDYNFSNFLFNRKNQLPVAAAKEFSKGNSPKLLIVYAAQGCGKTHLLSAIFFNIKQSVHKKPIFFRNITDLKTFFSNTLERIANIDCFAEFPYIILDDLQDCAGDIGLQKNIISVLEKCIEKNVYCAIGLSHSPAECDFFDPKLRSILEGGLAIELKKPDMDIKSRYVVSKAENLELHLNKDDVLFLARVYTDFRQIQGALLKVSAYKKNFPDEQQPIAAILKNNKLTAPLQLDPDQIIKVVSKYFNVAVNEITEQGRSNKVVIARQFSMYLCRDFLKIPLETVGKFFNGRGHSSVLYSCNKITSLVKSNKDMHNILTELKYLCMK